MGSLARLVVMGAAIDGGLWLAKADDPLPPDPARKARVALSLAADAARQQRVAGVLADDAARADRVAEALANAGRCSAGRAVPYPDAVALARGEGRVLVAFFGGAEVRCCSDAIPGTLPDVPAGYDPAKPVVVFVPTNRGLQVVKELPRDAPAGEVKVAVEAARKLIPPR